MGGKATPIGDLLTKLHTTLDEREAALNALRTYRLDDVLPELSGFLTGPDPDLCCDAARVILMLDREKGIELILPLLKNASGTVRWCACNLLHGSAKATEGLIEVLSSDPDADVRLMAASALGDTSDPSTLPALRHAVKNDKGADWEGRTVAEAAHKAIERITSPPKPLWS